MTGFLAGTRIIPILPQLYLGSRQCHIGEFYGRQEEKPQEKS